MSHTKYKKQYFPVTNHNPKWMKRDSIDTAPMWLSVDLRDGNQALPVPMTLEQKLEFFKVLVKVGFKEIEVGYPAASKTEFDFVRKLIDEKLVPDDVAIQVLTQAREDIIKKTFEALHGAQNANVHFCYPTSYAQRQQVFKKSKCEVKNMAVSGARLLKEYDLRTKGNFRYQFSPESFTGTEPEFALDVCNAVLNIWQPTPDKRAFINLPATVEHSMPHVYANQVEFMSENLNHRENVVLSLHPHNDRGTAVAAGELGLLAGGDRMEGTLFGNGERTGNADIVTLAMNMYSQGVDPKLDFSDMPAIVAAYEKATGIEVHERSPYAGDLVFSAFSGSHQDAIAKGMRYHRKNDCETWTVPYLPVDPHDVGREYDKDVIRIGSQAGGGGIGYVLEQHGYDIDQIDKGRLQEFSTSVKEIADKENRELSPDEIIAMYERQI